MMLSLGANQQLTNWQPLLISLHLLLLQTTNSVTLVWKLFDNAQLHTDKNVTTDRVNKSSVAQQSYYSVIKYLLAFGFSLGLSFHMGSISKSKQELHFSSYYTPPRIEVP